MTANELRTERAIIREEMRAAIEMIVRAIRMAIVETDPALKRSIMRWIDDLARVFRDRLERLRALEAVRMVRFRMVE